jgi:predicted Zn-dependent protease
MRRFFLLGLLSIIGHASVAQSEEVILKAMKDELQRNAKELSLPGYDKPFFIMYGLVDQKSIVVSGTLGSIINSNEDDNRYKSTTRILVGNYEFNDESLEDNIFSQPNAMEIGLPLDDDYWGIRRSFWATTDNVYRSAARHFEKHKQTLKESGKPLADLPHRWFGQVPAQKMIVTQPFVNVNRLEWETKVRELSGLFKTVPSISNSVVFVSFVQGHKYLVSTEGLEAKLPFSNASITVFVQAKEEGGKFLFDQISFEARTLDKLPAMAQLRSEVEKLIKRMDEEKKQPTLDEEYNGPILLEGAAVAQTFASTLMGGREGLFASDNIAKLKGFQFEDESFSSEGKVGKSIMNALISIKAKPKLKEYNGVDLLGSFLLDNEGVIPPDELMLVENGVLKNLLNNRTLTNANQTANGFANGPGVVEVTVAQKETDKVLRDKLLAQAKKEGLAFALILRDEASRGGMMNAYKVDVATGKEQLVRNVNLRELGFKTWKRILGASSTSAAHNLGGAGFGREFGPSFTSWIVPTAVLLEEGEVQPVRMPSLKEEEYITSPIANK